MLDHAVRTRSVLRLALAWSLLPSFAAAQQPAAASAPPTPPAINQPDDPLLRGFRWRSVGPVGQSGRVDDFAVDEKNTSTL